MKEGGKVSSGLLVMMVGNEMNDPEGDGAWGATQNMPFVPIHSMTVPSGKVFSFGTISMEQTAFVYSLYDPVTEELTILPNTTGTNIFCSNMSIDPKTGNVVVMGGDGFQSGGELNTGIKDVVIFDYKAEEIRPLSQLDEAFELESARWYGTTLNLANGEILMLGGIDEENAGSPTPEIYNHETGFRELPGAKIDDVATEGNVFYYPHAWQIDSGDVIVIERGGPDHEIYRMDVTGEGSVEVIGKLPFDTEKGLPSLMYDANKVLVADVDGRVWTADLAEDPTAWEVAFTVEDENTSDPLARIDGMLVHMPDGKVAFFGGSPVSQSLEDAQQTGMIWDPQTGETSFTEAGEGIRLYHSSAVLMQTGEVFVGGGGAPGPVLNTNFEIFSPAELFDEGGELDPDKPKILDAPKNVETGSTVRVTLDDTSDLERITFLKTGASTHGSNVDTRFLELDFEVMSEATVDVDIPDANVATPGAWMLFAVDSSGGYSEGSMTGVDMVDISSDESPVIPCFTPGTLIATLKGFRPVEALQPGDKVITRDRGAQPIVWWGSSQLSCSDLERRPELRPIRIEQGALGNGLPERCMVLSPNHRILISNKKAELIFGTREVLVAAKHLKHLPGVSQVQVSAVSYIHFMFACHELVLSDGAWTESFQPGDYSLQGIDSATREEILSLFPELATKPGRAAYTSVRPSLKRYEALLL